MNRGAATRDETKDTLETIAASTGNLQDATGFPPEGGQSGNEREEKRTILVIEGNVKKDALRIYRSRKVRGEHSVDRVLLVLLWSLVERRGRTIVREWIAASIGSDRAPLGIRVIFSK